MKQTVTLRGPRQTVTLAVPDAVQLKSITTGDQVQAIYTEAFAERAYDRRPGREPLFASTYAASVAAGIGLPGRWAHDPCRGSERSRRISALARAARASSAAPT